MHQTTLRIAPDLWETLTVEARLAGVSIAQYIREAALARLAYTAGRRGDAGYEAALRAAGADPEADLVQRLAEARSLVGLSGDHRAEPSGLWTEKPPVPREPPH
jgi:hypothetical protein